MKYQRKISSRFTFILRYVNPTGAIVAFVVLSKLLNDKIQAGQLPSWLMIIAVIAFIALLNFIKKKNSILFDYVYEDLDGLILKRKRTQFKIMYIDINRFELKYTNPPLIKIFFKVDGVENIASFVPPIRLFTFLEVPIFNELQSKINTKTLQ